MSRSQDEWPKYYISELSLLEHKYSPPPLSKLSAINRTTKKTNYQKKKSQITPNTNSDIFQPSENDLILN